MFRKNPMVWDNDTNKLWQVGYYHPDGQHNFQCQYEFDQRIDAAQQVHFLNGGNGGNCERVATKSGKDAIPETRSPMRRAT